MMSLVFKCILRVFDRHNLVTRRTRLVGETMEFDLFSNGVNVALQDVQNLRFIHNKLALF